MPSIPGMTISVRRRSYVPAGETLIFSRASSPSQASSTV